MAANEMSVVLDQTDVGSITFPESEASLAARRTASGFRVHLPMVVRLRITDPKKEPLLTNVTALVSVKGEKGRDVELGEARADGLVYNAGTGDGSRASSVLIWRGTLGALEYYERVRNEGPPALTLAVYAEGSYIVPFNGLRLRTEPKLVFNVVHLTYRSDSWAAMLRELGIIDIVTVDVPLPAVVPEKWKGVWREVEKARRAFEQRSESGWTHCVVSVRAALDEWKKIEPEQMWQGWQAPTKEQRETWAKTDRLFGLRWHLREAAHPAAHGGEDRWTREDARLMLAGLSSLLALRNP